MKGICLDPLDGPSVILSSEEHGMFTTGLRDATKGIFYEDLPGIWKAYQGVYRLKPHWLKAIEHYFVN